MNLISLRVRKVLCAAVVLLAGVSLSATDAGAAVSSATSTAKGTAAADMRLDYENGSRDSGYPKVGFNACCRHSIRLDDLPRTGKYAIRSHLKYDDPLVAGGTRAESHTLHEPDSYFHSGDTVYYGFSIYILSHWERDSREDILFQWKPWRDSCEANKYPAAFLTVQPSGKWRLRVNSDGNRCSTRDSVDMTSFDLADVKPGQWHDFVFRFEWSHGEQGRIDAWYQTHKNPGWRKVLSTTGPNTFNDEADTYGYLKWGIYKPAWNKGRTDVDSRVVFHDNIAVGDSFSEVNPVAD